MTPVYLSRWDKKAPSRPRPEWINNYLLELDSLLPRKALPVIEGLTQIASAPTGDSLLLETARLAAGTLLRNYRNGTLEHGRLVLLAGVLGLSGQQELYRERHVLELPYGDLDEFSRCLVIFAATGDLAELDYRAGRPVYRFLPLEEPCGEGHVDQSFLWE